MAEQQIGVVCAVLSSFVALDVLAFGNMPLSSPLSKPAVSKIVKFEIVYMSNWVQI